MKITAHGPAVAQDAKTGAVITNPKTLLKLDSLLYDEDSCVNYLQGPLANLGLQGGQLHLKFDGKKGELSVVTVFGCFRELKEAELKKLLKETQGQWSDGIGEGAFIHGEKLGIHVDVSPTVAGRKPAITQVDDGMAIEKPKPNLLAAAISKGDAKRAAELIEKGAELERPSSEGSQPLASACISGMYETALLLIEKGANPNARTMGKEWNVPLVYTAMCRCDREPASPTSVDVARALLAKGAAIDGTDAEGRTALMFAANRGKPKLVKFLLDQRANINLQADRQRSGHTALMLSHDAGVSQILLEHGADTELRNVFGATALEMALEDADDPDSRKIAKILQQFAAKK